MPCLLGVVQRKKLESQKVSIDDIDNSILCNVKYFYDGDAFPGSGSKRFESVGLHQYHYNNIIGAYTY